MTLFDSLSAVLTLWREEDTWVSWWMWLSCLARGLLSYLVTHICVLTHGQPALGVSPTAFIVKKLKIGIRFVALPGLHGC